MATHQDFVEYVRTQSGLGDAISCRRMFGEYAIYVEGKVVALACDDQLFLKPTAHGRSLLRAPVERPPFPGAKDYFRIDEAIDDRELLRRLLLATAEALPEPRPKKPRAVPVRGATPAHGR